MGQRYKYKEKIGHIFGTELNQGFESVGGLAFGTAMKFLSFLVKKILSIISFIIISDISIYN